MIPEFAETDDHYYVTELYVEPNADVDRPTINGEVYRFLDQEAYGRTTASPTVSIDGLSEVDLAGDDSVPIDVLEVRPETLDALEIPYPPALVEVAIPTAELAHRRQMDDHHRA